MQELDQQKQAIEQKILQFGQGHLKMYEMYKQGELTEEEYKARHDSINRSYPDMIQDQDEIMEEYLQDDMAYTRISAYLGYEPLRLQMTTLEWDKLHHILKSVILKDDGSLEMEYHLKPVPIDI